MSWSLRSGSGPGRAVGQDVVHGLADGVNAGRVFVGHLQPVGVLELLHERVEIQRVRREVLPEMGGFGDRGRIGLQLVRQVVAYEGEDFVARHDSSGTLATASDAVRIAPAATSREWVRPATSSRTPVAATSIARWNPRAPKEPCGTTPRCRSPSSTAPPCSSGSRSLRSPRSAGRSSSPPTLLRRFEVAAPRTAPSSAADAPSIVFSAMLPVKPSATITSASPVPIAKPSTLPTKFSPSLSASCWLAATTISVPLVASVPF